MAALEAADLYFSTSQASIEEKVASTLLVGLTFGGLGGTIGYLMDQRLWRLQERECDLADDQYS